MQGSFSAPPGQTADHARSRTHGVLLPHRGATFGPRGVLARPGQRMPRPGGATVVLGCVFKEASARVLGWNAGRKAGDRSGVREHPDHGAEESTRMGGRTVRLLTRAAPVAGLTAGVPYAHPGPSSLKTVPSGSAPSRSATRRRGPSSR